jgi:hypothetical protein
MSAFWISPKGEIVFSGTTHIGKILEKPAKFGLNRETIEFLYKKHDERIGQEGRAREEIMLNLFKEGWIRLRKYRAGMRTWWSVNVRELSKRIRVYLQKWASKLLQGRLQVREEDPYVEIRVDRLGGKVLSSNMKAVAQSPDFVAECTEDYDMKVCDIEELEDRPLIPLAEEIMRKIDEQNKR